MEDNFVSQMGGVPLIDNDVNYVGIATLACAVRRRLGQEPNANLREFLEPVRAYTCYQTAYPKLGPERLSEELTSEQVAAVEVACSEILIVMPEWRTAFAIPLRWRLVRENIASSTNPRVPQTIFFGAKAFTNILKLQEQIVHELSHTWLGMIGEVSPLSYPSQANYILPSGTKNKEYWNLIFALSFAITAIRFYEARHRSGRFEDGDYTRIQYLKNYSRGCIAQANSEPKKLRAAGRAILETCQRYIYTEGFSMDCPSDHKYRDQWCIDEPRPRSDGV